jgi:ribonuclease P protein component
MLQGARRESDHFIVYRHDSILGKTQFCFKTPRRLGNAVRRNRLKRLVYSTHNRSGLILRGGVVPKYGTFELDFQQVSAELQQLFGHE